MSTRARARSLALVVPGAIETLTGGYGYDRRIVEGLRRRGWTVDVVELDGDFPFPSPAARARAGAALRALPDAAVVLVDGLALGALPDEAARESSRLRLAALVHHPLAAETGVSAEAAAALEDTERRALRAARVVVVTSHATAAGLARYGVDPAVVRVIEPGTDRAPLARGSGDAAHPVVTLVCVATIVPRKGHDVLVRALAAVSDLGWQLSCVGSLERDPVTVTHLQRQIRDCGLVDRVTLVGELDRTALDARYDRADVFVLPTWHEGYGMAVAEALARGLPVVSTATGAIGALVGPDAGVLVPPGDVPALAAALRAVIGDAACRARLAAGARRVRDHLPTWEDAALRMEEALDGIDG